MRTGDLLVVAVAAVAGFALDWWGGPRPPRAPGAPGARAAAVLGLVVLAGLAVLLAGCPDTTVESCPGAVVPSSCAAFTGADLPSRCDQVYPGSSALILRREAPADPACTYPPPLGLFVGRFECGDSPPPVELWCIQ